MVEHCCWCLLVTMPTVRLLMCMCSSFCVCVCVCVFAGVAEQFAIAEAKLRAWSSVDGDESNDDSYDEDFLLANEPITQSTGKHTHSSWIAAIDSYPITTSFPVHLSFPLSLALYLSLSQCPSFHPLMTFFFFPSVEFDMPPASLISFPFLQRQCPCEDGVCEWVINTHSNVCTCSHVCVCVYQNFHLDYMQPPKTCNAANDIQLSLMASSLYALSFFLFFFYSLAEAIYWGRFHTYQWAGSQFFMKHEPSQRQHKSLFCTLQLTVNAPGVLKL